MELPQSLPFGAEGRQPTHDFLSLISHSSTQQDQRPPSQGGHLKTHDFLQLEQLGNTSSKEETPLEMGTTEKPPPPPPAPPPSVEHVLPGGIGTNSISHRSSYFYPRVPKAEGTIFTVAQGSSSLEKNDESSNCSSYTGSGFMLWEESARKKGKTVKENSSGETPVVQEATRKAGQWATSSLERASQSSTSNHHNSFNSSHSSQPSSKQKSQSFMEMMISAKAGAQDDDFEEDEDFVLKKESSATTHSRGELRVKVDGKSSTDQKANTPRSKHSATEQRRRSKINDRFQMLRSIIPQSDQKRDKASLLFEVIEYIQFLQEKVQKYEATYQPWSHEPSNLMPWRKNHKPVENYADQSRAINGMPAPALLLSAKLDEKNIVAPTVPSSVQNPIESDLSTATPFRAIDLCPAMMNKTIPFPVSLQPNFISAQNTCVAAQIPLRLPSDVENSESQPQSVLCHTGSCSTNGALPSEKLKEQELTIEDGTISISSVYSQGLLNTLTQALQASGVDLSHASISVQIELGKGASGSRPTPNAPTSTLRIEKLINQGSMRSRVGCSEDCSNQPLKKLKT